MSSLRKKRDSQGFKIAQNLRTKISTLTEKEDIRRVFSAALKTIKSEFIKGEFIFNPVIEHERRIISGLFNDRIVGFTDAANEWREVPEYTSFTASIHAHDLPGVTGFIFRTQPEGSYGKGFSVHLDVLIHNISELEGGLDTEPPWVAQKIPRSLTWGRDQSKLSLERSYTVGEYVSIIQSQINLFAIHYSSHRRIFSRF